MAEDSAAAAESEAPLERLVGGELRALLRMLDGSDVEELELEMGETRLAFRRDLSAVAAPEPSAEDSSSFEDQTGTPILAERVGFFHFPDTGGPRVGEQVKAGQVVGVIDSLNIPSPVAAPLAGRVEQVLVEHGQPVEYGQVLLVIAAEEG